MDYITMDFETANHRLTSACSMGIVGVKNNKIIFKEYYLINPKEEFSDYNIAIHKITPRDVENADTFDRIWEKIKKYFQNTIVFAHDANFDIKVLKSLIEKYNLDLPSIRIGCTLKISLKVWKDELKNHRLNTISEYLEVEHLHHNALSDARVCFEIISRSQEVMNVLDVIELYDILGIRFGIYNNSRFSSTSYRYKRNKKHDIVLNSDLNDKVIYISGKPLTITKRQLSEKLLLNGVFLERNINRSLDIFILLENSPKDKLIVVEDLISKGVPIKIVTENEIIKMMK